MITLNFRQFPEDLPALGQDIVVILDNNKAFWYCYDSLQKWRIEALDSEDKEIPHTETLTNLAKTKDTNKIYIIFSQEALADTTLYWFLQMKFLWLPMEEYKQIDQYFKQ